MLSIHIVIQIKFNNYQQIFNQQQVQKIFLSIYKTTTATSGDLYYILFGNLYYKNSLQKICPFFTELKLFYTLKFCKNIHTF